MPKNQPIPPIPKVIRRWWLSQAGRPATYDRPAGVSRVEVIDHCRAEMEKLGHVENVYRRWAEQLTSEGVARVEGLGRTCRLVSSEKRQRNRKAS